MIEFVVRLPYECMYLVHCNEKYTFRLFLVIELLLFRDMIVSVFVGGKTFRNRKKENKEKGGVTRRSRE